MTPPPARIIHVASGREWRGGQRQVALLAGALAKNAVDQIVVTTAGSRLAETLHDAGVPVAAVSWDRAISLAALGAILREARRRPAILHAHDAHALLLAGIAATLTGARLVVTRRVDFHLRRRGFWVRADRVIAISAAVREILIADGVSPDRIEVIHSGIDVESTRQVRSGSIRAELGLSPDTPLAVSIAALVAHKDHRTMVEAAALLRSRIPDLHWAVAGGGPLRDELVTMARDAGLQSHIHWLGHVADPLPLLRSAELFVMSSAEEGLGTSVLDAMALGIPVVATRAGGIPEMLSNGAGYLVPVRDPAALADAVETALADPEGRAATVERATKVVDRFSADGMAAGVLRVYRSVTLDH